MRVQLAFGDRNLDLDAPSVPNADALVDDLGLRILFEAMAAGDPFLLQVARSTVLSGPLDVAQIRYRQAVLSDCLAHPDTVRGLYALAVEAIERERRVWGYSARYPASLLRRSVDVMKAFVELLRRLRAVAAAEGPAFESDGFRRLFAEIVRELDDPYLDSIERHLQRLRFRDGVRLSAELGPANRGTNYVLRRRTGGPGWRERVGLAEPDSYSWTLPERDEAGAQALAELRGRGLALAANVLAQSTDHILGYFQRLRSELGFYVGCLNLHDALRRKGEPVCLPVPSIGGPSLSARGLYDPCLSLALPDRAVGNDVDADGKRLVVITGANRGGKSTFLRSLGVAQLMLGSGMFVAADSFGTDVRSVFTHFKREEDAALRSGKLDEELERMSAILDQLRPDSLILLNESFASTNEREGAEIGGQIVRALLEAGMTVGYVTHMFALASSLRAERDGDALSMRAERLPDGARTFRVVEGDPQPTSHGLDIYHRVLGEAPSPVPAGSGPSA